MYLRERKEGRETRRDGGKSRTRNSRDGKGFFKGIEMKCLPPSLSKIIKIRSSFFSFLFQNAATVASCCRQHLPFSWRFPQAP